MSPHQPGWRRRRAGKGWVYLDTSGSRLAPAEVERIKALVIPPAWKEVWICPFPSGHLQAVGTDAAGRRQYLYHPVWREQRDLAKFDRVVAMAKLLPRVRERLRSDLSGEEMTRERALATAVRLIDLGSFRVGNDEYADQHGSYGITTVERRHVTRSGAGFTFCFEGKSGVTQQIEVTDPEVCRAVDQMRRRRGGLDQVLAYRERGRWRDVTSTDVNDYLREVFGAEVTAKDFRTWHATVHAAESLAVRGDAALTKTAQRRVVREAVKDVAAYLGNTPTIARNSYIDPRVIDLYEDGTTVAHALRRLPRDPDRRQEHLERAVLRLLSKAPRRSGSSLNPWPSTSGSNGRGKQR